MTVISGLLAIGMALAMGMAQAPVPVPVQVPVPEDDDAKAMTDVDRSVLDLTSQISERIAELRGREFRRPLEAGIRTRDQLAAFMREQFDKELPDAEARSYELRMKHFGLWPEALPFKETMISFLTLQVGGFYDPETKKLYCISSNLGMLQNIVMSHEIHHALQDQYCDLLKFYEDAKDNEDVASARQAVVEGEAQYMSERYAQKYAAEIGDLTGSDPRALTKLMLEQMISLGSAPPVLADTMTFPYVQGSEFVGAVKAKRGLAGLDRLFVDPPVSTEQVLHPEKYLDTVELPVPVQRPDLGTALGEDYEQIGHDTMGEFLVFTWGKLVAQDPVRAMRGSRGWGGDAYQMWARRGTDETILAWWSVWDTEQDAKEFFDLARKALSNRRGVRDGKAKLEDGDSVVRLSGSYGHSLVERRGTTILVLDGAFRDRAHLDRTAALARPPE